MRAPDSPGEERPRPHGRPASLVGLALLALAVAAALALPRYDWDVLAYAGVALERAGADVEEVHRGAYASLRAAADAETVRALEGGNDYRRAVARDPVAFAEQLGFYRARWLHVAAMRALASLGLPLARAASVSSALAAGLAGLVLLRWLGLRRGGWTALALTAAIAWASGLSEVARLATPDALAALLLLSGLCSLALRLPPALAGALFALALLARADHVVLALPAVLLAAGAYERQAERGAARAVAAALALLAAGLVGLSAGHGWWTAYHHTFFGYLRHPASDPPAFDAATWLAHVLRSLPQLREPRCALFLLVAAGGLLALRKRADATAERRLLVALLIGFALHFALFPAVWPRLFAGYWTGAAAVLAALPPRTAEPDATEASAR